MGSAVTTRRPAIEYGAALLRTAMGLLFLGHVALRVTVITMPVAMDFFRSIGLPGAFAYVDTAVEALCGALLVSGWRVRLASLAGAVILIGATVLVHWRNGFFFTNPGGGWEYPVFWAVALVAQSLIGPGWVPRWRRSSGHRPDRLAG